MINALAFYKFLNTLQSAGGSQSNTFICRHFTHLSLTMIIDVTLAVMSHFLINKRRHGRKREFFRIPKTSLPPSATFRLYPGILPCISTFSSKAISILFLVT